MGEILFRKLVCLCAKSPERDYTTQFFNIQLFKFSSIDKKYSYQNNDDKAMTSYLGIITTRKYSNFFPYLAICAEIKLTYCE